MDYPLISIVVPLYNSQPFLEEGIRSVLRQTYENIEVVCVDDASTDDTKEIIEAIAREDQRVKLICNATNMGPGYSRNMGIEASSGKYLSFFDHDDKVENNWIELLHKTLVANNTNIAICNGMEFCEDTNSGNRIGYKNIKGTFLVKKSKNEDFFTTYIPPWLKIYAREFIVNYNIKFDEQHNKFDDVIFHFYCMYYADEVSIIEEKLYHHRVWSESITRRANADRDNYFDHLKTLKSIIRKAEYDGIDVIEVLKIYLPFVRYHASLVISKKKYISEINQMVAGYNVGWKFLPKFYDVYPSNLRRLLYACELFVLDNKRFFDKLKFGKHISL